MPGFPYADHPPEDDEPSTRWCAQHDKEHAIEEWCPVCYEDACREAKALDETMPTFRVSRETARAARRADMAEFNRALADFRAVTMREEMWRNGTGRD
jgi:hypothetical protein